MANLLPLGVLGGGCGFPPTPALPILPEEEPQSRFELVALFSTTVLYFICVNSVCAHVHAHTRVETANTLSMLEGVFVSALVTDQASKRMPVT